MRRSDEAWGEAWRDPSSGQRCGGFSKSQKIKAVKRVETIETVEKI
ncbi:hypothetical protein GCM10012286_57160 [Streptomyces lasiicapitis]|uniref:Uncharacterized protein n=1 Tax=Streptomyces lasiicapitis TaxID=1923961 RepID=A0ABQ2MIG0_9ACTN|nr:hypothetical protein GCM10012286_57160 [Streptomyces lasiicapitis]